MIGRWRERRRRRRRRRRSEASGVWYLVSGVRFLCSF